MQERKIVLTREAIYDLTDIADYIEQNFGKSRADRFEKEIRQQIKDIGYTGGFYGNTHIYYRSYSIFKKTFPPSIIFYIINEPKNEIHILRVLREERDWKNILKEQQYYTYPE
ncbi:MAG: type II toxin-antitoxin system RelE/ParE family toxin [Muribaculaceae bacterium]|nr:type II toxin-antitoxin system RelE/ParE family toxin [Roseburia sp.]MCM1431458.1 type II toxin-antitoxin system RelE/ParE family toxin [Muribaculaceae bacterium]MCM1493248.1 type II toxin-antitoxin system RelE/ParE family toxin [Muribaculaceae bacterium]